MDGTTQMIDQFALSRVTVFVGAFGSGKTELALNFAIRLADAGSAAGSGSGDCGRLRDPGSACRYRHT